VWWWGVVLMDWMDGRHPHTHVQIGAHTIITQQVTHAVCAPQVNDEGEVALRLALTVVAAPALPAPPARRAGLVTGTTSSSPDASEFEVGVHLNLSELLGLPSVRKASALSAERHGPGSAARGLLIIGDLGPLRASSGPGSSGPGPGSSGLDGGHGGGPLPHRPPPLGLALLRGVAAMPAAQDGGAAPPLGS
jgi:hypothetical protein